MKLILFLSLLTFHCLFAISNSIYISDNLPDPTHTLDEGPLRIVVNDVLRSSGNSVTLSGKIECGFVETGDKVYVMPEANPVTVKGHFNFFNFGITKLNFYY